MRVARSNVSTVRRLAGPRHGAPGPLLVAASVLALLLLACGGSDEDDRTGADAAVAAGAGAGVSTATPTPTEPPSPSVEDQQVAGWGEHVCGVTSSFAIDFLASGDPRDPTALDLEARRERAVAMFPVQYDAVRAAAEALDGVEPPARTAQLHRLLLATYLDLDRALEEQERAIREAVTTDEIEASNLEVNQLIELAFRQASLLLNAGYC